MSGREAVPGTALTVQSSPSHHRFSSLASDEVSGVDKFTFHPRVDRPACKLVSVNFALHTPHDVTVYVHSVIDKSPLID